MLTNTVKAVYPDLVIAPKGVTAFADDNDISSWAKDSVYFIVQKDIISGVGDNKFAPKNITEAEVATGYANATREQALIIPAKSFSNIKE